MAQKKTAVPVHEPFLVKNGNYCFGVYFTRQTKAGKPKKEKPWGITFAKTGQQAVRNVWKRLIEKEFKLTFDQALPRMRAVMLHSPEEWEKEMQDKAEAERRKIEWQGMLFGKPMAGKITKAVSVQEAAKNKWHGRFRAKYDHGQIPEQEVLILYNSMTARPVFGQARPKPFGPRKVSHELQPSLFNHD